SGAPGREGRIRDDELGSCERLGSAAQLPILQSRGARVGVRVPPERAGGSGDEETVARGACRRRAKSKSESGRQGPLGWERSRPAARVERPVAGRPRGGRASGLVPQSPAAGGRRDRAQPDGPRRVRPIARGPTARAPSPVIRRVLQYLPVMLLGRPWHGPERYRPFFFIGSGRCGSTLLRAILQTHPDVHIPPENAMVFALQSYRRYSRLPWSVLLRIVLPKFEFHPQWDMFQLPLAPLFRELAPWPRERRNLAAVLDALYRAHAKAYKPSATRWGDKTPAANTFLLPTLEA